MTKVRFIIPSEAIVLVLYLSADYKTESFVETNIFNVTPGRGNTQEECPHYTDDVIEWDQMLRCHHYICSSQEICLRLS